MERFLNENRQVDKTFDHCWLSWDSLFKLHVRYASFVKEL
jgi:hypothetical protein